MTKFLHHQKKSNSKIGKIFKTMRVKPEKKGVKILIIALIACFGVGYLVQVNSLATKGYQIKELENQITTLQQEKADLELQSLSLQSMSAVKDRLAQSGMVATQSSDYLEPTPVAMAR